MPPSPLRSRFVIRLGLLLLPLLCLAGVQAAGPGGKSGPLPWPPPKQLTGFLSYTVVSDYTEPLGERGTRHIVEHYSLNFDKLQFPANLPRCRRGTYYFFNQGTLHLSAAGSSRDYTGFLGDGSSEHYYTEYSNPVSMTGPNLSAYAEAYSDNAAFVTFSAILPSQTQVTYTTGETGTLQGADLFSDGVRGTVVRRNPLVIKFESQTQAGNQTKIISGVLSSAPAKVIKVTPNHTEVLLPDGKDSVEVTFTATTDPPDMPVEWSGDLGDDPDKQDDTLTTHYNSSGIKLVTADIKTGESTNAREPRQAGPGSSATARLPAIQVRFESSDGATMPDPQRVGVPTHLHPDDRFLTFRATVTPAESVRDVHLEASDGVELRQFAPSNGAIKFKLAGKKEHESHDDGDEWVRALDRAGTGEHRQRVSVVVPRWVVSQIPTGAMQTHDWLLNADTTPRVTGVPTGMGGPYTWRGWDVTVHVQDQLSHDCGDVYGGALITEKFVTANGLGSEFSIWRELGSDSQYTDPVGYANNGINNPLRSFKPRNHQPGTSFLHYDIPANAVVEARTVQVYVDSFALRPLLTRIVTPVPPDHVLLDLRP